METLDIKKIIADSENEISILIQKVINLQKAINIIEEEGINLPESVYGTKDYYVAEVEKQVKLLNQLKRLSNGV